MLAGDGLFSFIQVSKNLLRSLKEGISLLGERLAPGRALDQLNTHALFQVTDSPAEYRLGNTGFLGSVGKTARLADRNKGF